MLSTQSFSLFFHREEDFFSFKHATWLTGNRSYFIFIANISSVPQASFVSVPRTNPGCNAPVRGLLLPWGSQRDTSGVISPTRLWGFAGLGCAVLSLCWKGRAGCFKDILRLCSFVAEFQSERHIYFTYTCCSSGPSILTSTSWAFLSPCCLCPVECDIRVRLFIYSVWICKSL